MALECFSYDGHIQKDNYCFDFKSIMGAMKEGKYIDWKKKNGTKMLERRSF